MTPSKFLISIFLIPFIAFSSYGQVELQKGKEYEVTCVGFYNLENLFDTLDTEHTEDTEYTPEGDNKWNTKRYREKLNNLAEVISKLGKEVTPTGPTILGVSEVENRRVLEDLVETGPLKEMDFGIVHHQSPDERGIDVALLYQKEHFKVTDTASFKVELEEDDKTRDQLLVSGDLNGEQTHFIVAHWPSRSGGQARSEPGRVAAAKVGRSILDSLLKEDPQAKIMYMGDLNDDPVNKSVQKVLKAKGKRRKVKDEELFNPMRDLFDKGIGTLAWRDNWNLFDQILLSSSLIEEKPDSYRYYKAKVFNKDFLKQKEGNFRGYPLRSYVGSTYMGGYSDHFPVYVFLIREK